MDDEFCYDLDGNINISGNDKSLKLDACGNVPEMDHSFA